MRFWLIIVILPPPSTKQAPASWEACEYSLPDVVFLGKAHGMSRLPLESLLNFLLASWCCTCEASVMPLRLWQRQVQ